METSSVVALVAIGLSALTFVATQFGSKRTATASYVTGLERRVAALELENEQLRNRNAVITDENLGLMKKLLANGDR